MLRILRRALKDCVTNRLLMLTRPNRIADLATAGATGYGALSKPFSSSFGRSSAAALPQPSRTSHCDSRCGVQAVRQTPKTPCPSQKLHPAIVPAARPRVALGDRRWNGDEEACTFARIGLFYHHTRAGIGGHPTRRVAGRPVQLPDGVFGKDSCPAVRLAICGRPWPPSPPATP